MISGTVAINENLIISWFATRQEKTEIGSYRYDCYADGRDLKGQSFKYRFSLFHYPADGAIRLTEQVMGILDYRVRCSGESRYE